ncbi:site-specific integrase [Corallococcus sp. AB030]|nr:site-specific integrase [Corallococcus sp. AB030]
MTSTRALRRRWIMRHRRRGSARVVLRCPGRNCRPTIGTWTTWPPTQAARRTGCTRTWQRAISRTRSAAASCTSTRRPSRSGSSASRSPSRRGGGTDMAGVRKRGQRYYAILKDSAGRKVERAVKGRTLTEARKNARDLEERAWRTRNNLGTEPTAETLAEAAPRFLKASRHQASFNSLESRWRLHILPALGALPVGQIRPTNIDELLAAKLDDGYGQQTRRHLRMTLSAFFKWAMKDGLVERNPVHEVEAIAVPDANPKALTWSQLEALRDAATLPWLKDLIWVAAHLALRYIELRRMKWEHVDFRRGVIETTRAKRVTTRQRSESSRPAVIPDVLLPYLRAMWARRRGEYLFCYEDGGQLPKTSPHARFKAALKAAKIIQGYRLICRRRGCGFSETAKSGKSTPCPRCGFALWSKVIPGAFSFKDLRSSAITRIIDVTGNARVAQLQADHADMKTTLKHYHAKNVDVQREALNRAFGGGSSPPSAPPPQREMAST